MEFGPEAEALTSRSTMKCCLRIYAWRSVILTVQLTEVLRKSRHYIILLYVLIPFADMEIASRGAQCLPMLAR